MDGVVFEVKTNLSLKKLYAGGVAAPRSARLGIHSQIAPWVTFCRTPVIPIPLLNVS